jgi:hypothetical protein
MMAPRPPDGIDASNVAERRGPPSGAAALVVLGAMIGVALLGILGGGSDRTWVTRSLETELSVRLPQPLRSGMFFETTIRAVAQTPLTDATIAMSPSLWDNVTINRTIPQAAEEEYRDDLLLLHYGSIAAGEPILLKLNSQINPDLIWENPGEIQLRDSERVIARLPITVTVLP